MRPLVVELYAGSFGWSAAWLEMGGAAVGFDIEHLPHHGLVPAGAELVLQDVTTLHGSQFRNAALILASPPCHEFSYMAMPWKRSKHIAAVFREEIEDFPSNYHGSKTLAELTELFDACFRIQREACEAAGRYIPMVVENVKGAQKWVGEAQAHFGSYYLWGDVRRVGRQIVGRPELSPLRFGEFVRARRAMKRPGRNFHAFENGFGTSPSFHGADHETRGLQETRNTDEATKVSGLDWNNFGDPDYKPKGFNVTAAQRYREEHAGTKNDGGSWFAIAHNTESGVNNNARDNAASGINSKSDSRKAASAAIARIPLALSRYIAQVYYPDQEPVN